MDHDDTQVSLVEPAVLRRTLPRLDGSASLLLAAWQADETDAPLPDVAADVLEDSLMRLVEAELPRGSMLAPWDRNHVLAVLPSTTPEAAARAARRARHSVAGELARARALLGGRRAGRPGHARPRRAGVRLRGPSRPRSGRARLVVNPHDGAHHGPRSDHESKPTRGRDPGIGRQSTVRAPIGVAPRGRDAARRAARPTRVPSSPSPRRPGFDLFPRAPRAFVRADRTVRWPDCCALRSRPPHRLRLPSRAGDASLDSGRGGSPHAGSVVGDDRPHRRRVRVGRVPAGPRGRRRDPRDLVGERPPRP